MMEYVKVKIVERKPLLRINSCWFPYYNIVNKEEFDDEVCTAIGEKIENHGRRNVLVYYNVEERDDKNRPTKIRVGYAVKRKSNEKLDCVFNTVYDRDPLKCTYTLSIDSNVDPYIYKRFMSPEDYISE